MNPQNNFSGPRQSFGYPTTPNPYQMPQAPDNRKKLFMMAGGAVVIVLLLIWLVFGGKSTGGQTDMQSLMQNTSDAIGALDDYQSQLASSGTKNDMALSLIILRGSYQNLNELYTKTYKPKKKFSQSPQPDSTSKKALDEAARDNKLDSAIVELLKTKVNNAYQALQKTKPNFKKKSSVETLKNADTDLKSVYEILQAQR